MTSNEQRFRNECIDAHLDAALAETKRLLIQFIMKDEKVDKETATRIYEKMPV